MSHYLVEIRIGDVGRRQRARVAAALEAARSRLRQAGGEVPGLASAVAAREGGLTFVVVASDPEAAQRLLRTALLPPFSLREVDGPAVSRDTDPRVA